VNYYYY